MAQNFDFDDLARQMPELASAGPRMDPGDNQETFRLPTIERLIPDAEEVLLSVLQPIISPRSSSLYNFPTIDDVKGLIGEALGLLTSEASAEFRSDKNGANAFAVSLVHVVTRLFQLADRGAEYKFQQPTARLSIIADCAHQVVTQLDAFADKIRIDVALRQAIIDANLSMLKVLASHVHLQASLLNGYFYENTINALTSLLRYGSRYSWWIDLRETESFVSASGPLFAIWRQTTISGSSSAQVRLAGSLATTFDGLQPGPLVGVVEKSLVASVRHLAPQVSEILTAETTEAGEADATADAYEEILKALAHLHARTACVSTEQADARWELWSSVWDRFDRFSPIGIWGLAQTDPRGAIGVLLMNLQKSEPALNEEQLGDLVWYLVTDTEETAANYLIEAIGTLEDDRREELVEAIHAGLRATLEQYASVQAEQREEVSRYTEEVLVFLEELRERSRK